MNTGSSIGNDSRGGGLAGSGTLAAPGLGGDADAPPPWWARWSWVPSPRRRRAAVATSTTVSMGAWGGDDRRGPMLLVARGALLASGRWLGRRRRCAAAGGGAVGFTVRRRRRRDGTTPTCTARARAPRAAWPPPAGGDVMRRVGGRGRGRQGGRRSRASWLVSLVWWARAAIFELRSLSCSPSPFRLSLVAHSCRAHV